MNRPTILISLVLSLLPLQIWGCGEADPPDHPADGRGEKFKDYYASETIQRELSRIRGEDQAILGLRLDSLRKHFGFSVAETESLLAFVRDSLPRWESFLNDILDRVERQQDRSNPGVVTPQAEIGRPTN